MDPDTADQIRHRLRAVREATGMAMLYTSHNMREMEEMCDRIIFLYQGRILMTGTPKELVDTQGAEDLEALFLQIARGQVKGADR
ncbi:Energy-coupling factor transporter ATP-binding protein EcfA2 [compost metagenome]